MFSPRLHALESEQLYCAVHGGSFWKNFAHFSGDFCKLKKVEKVKKMVLKEPKMAKKGLKSLRKVHKYQETVKIGPKIAQ